MCARWKGVIHNLLRIRFNPDAYKVDGVTTRTRMTVDRHAALKSVIESYIPTQPVSVKYMYYDMKDGDLCVLSDPEYPEMFKQFVLSQ